MAKEVMILNDSDFAAMVPTEAALDCYKFATAMAGVEMDEEAEADFIVKRNAKRGWLELAELKSRFEKAAESIKTALKHTFNVGGVDDLPNAKECGYKVSWSKPSYTYEWMVDGFGPDVMQRLQEMGLCSVDQVLNLCGVNIFAKAAGISQEKMFELFPEYVCAKAKESTLKIQ